MSKLLDAAPRGTVGESAARQTGMNLLSGSGSPSKVRRLIIRFEVTSRTSRGPCVGRSSHLDTR